jgi:hypothetical protein
MPKLQPQKITSSNLLSILYVYSKNLQMLDDELNRTKLDQNVATCRAEYLQQIWGDKLGQVFTSDFSIDAYRELLIKLVNISLTDSVRQNIVNTMIAYFPDIVVNVYEYWKQPDKFIGYDWQNTSFKWMGAGDAPLAGNVWNGTKPWIPDLKLLGFFPMGVQIQVHNILQEDVRKFEAYVIPALKTFVKPAGIYYEIVVMDINITRDDGGVLTNIKTESTRTPEIRAILGFGVSPFGSPSPLDPADSGFGSPSMPI